MLKQSNNPEGADIKEISPGELLYNYFLYWPFLVLMLLISMTGAWLYLRYKVPVYKTSASLLIKDDKKGGNSTDMLEAFDMFSSKKNVENEVEVLKSKTLLKEVVKNLYLYGPVTIQGRVTNQSGYESSPIRVELKLPDSIEYSGKIHFTYNDTAHLVKIENSNYPLDQWVLTPYGILKFHPNKYYHSLGKPEIGNNFYFSFISLKNAVNGIYSAIQITSSNKESTVINLTIEGEVKVRGEDILNELLRVYNRAAILDKNVLAANTLKFVEDRLKFVEGDLDSIEGSLQSFKANNRITDISAQGQIYLQTVAANDQKVTDINMQLAVLDQVENYVSSHETEGGIVPATLGVGDPTLTALLQKLSEQELEYTQTKKIVPENNPSVVALVDGINRLKPGILANLRSQRKNLLAGRNDLEGTNNKFSSMLKTIPEKERELLSISRQQAIKNNIYTFLLQKREETALSFASTVADSRIIDRAESLDVPVSPKRKLIYLATLVATIAVWVAVIFIKEMLVRTVQQRSDIEKYIDLPFLGEVMFDNSKSQIVIAEGKRSFIAEQFRQLRTSLGYMGIDENHKRILVTSSISGEGKSFISINLGISLALMEKRVALIELDLRKPKLSEQFKISRDSGISNYLIGKVKADEIIKSTEIENLFLIPSGPIPPNPSELIANGRLIELLIYLEKTFDYTNHCICVSD